MKMEPLYYSPKEKTYFYTGKEPPKCSTCGQELFNFVRIARYSRKKREVTYYCGAKCAGKGFGLAASKISVIWSPNPSGSDLILVNDRLELGGGKLDVFSLADFNGCPDVRVKDRTVLSGRFDRRGQIMVDESRRKFLARDVELDKEFDSSEEISAWLKKQRESKLLVGSEKKQIKND